MYIKPEIFSDPKQIPQGTAIVEAFEGAIKELFFINNPFLKKNTPAAEQPLSDFMNNHGISGIWVYYPWTKMAVHTIPEELYFKLRTSRNRDIISDAEQQAYRQLNVGVAGLSVGSAIVSAINISGGPKHLKIADFDTVEISNLNRIKAHLTDIGLNKTHIAAREVWLLDPFAELELWDNGLSTENLRKFILDPRLDVFIDEMDSLDLKIVARFICKENKIPVLMATDNGDSIILDVERFDLEPEREIFHGLIGDMHPDDLKNLDFKQWLQLATRIVGPEYLTERMQQSLMDISKNIPAVPQLGTTANTAGSAMGFVLRRIANKLDMPSGRYTVDFEEKLIAGYNDPNEINKRKQKTEDFIDAFKNKK